MFETFSLPQLLLAGLVGLLILLLGLLPMIWRDSGGGNRGRSGGSLRYSLAARLERLAGPTRLKFWQDQLFRAEVPLQPGELYGLACFIALLGTILLVAWFGYPLLALGGGMLLGAIPFYLVLRRANQQEREFLDLLKSTCMMLSGAALSGASPERLLGLLARSRPPIKGYFAQIVEQVPNKGHLGAIDEVADGPHPPQLNALLNVFRLYFAEGGGGPVAGQLRAAAEDITLRIRLADTFRIKLERIQTQFWLVIGVALFVFFDLCFQEPEIGRLLLSSWVGQVYLLVLASFALLMGWGLRRFTRLPGDRRPQRRSKRASKGGQQ